MSARDPREASSCLHRAELNTMLYPLDSYTMWSIIGNC